MYNYSSFEILMKIFDLIDGIKEDKDLRTSTVLYFLIEMLENSSDDVLMHLLLRFTHSIVILHSLQCYFFA